MIVQDFLFPKCRRLPSEYHLSSSLRNMNYTQKQYCDGPSWRGTSFQIINIYFISGQNCDSSKGWYESDMDSEELQGYVRVHAIYVTLLLQLV
jgi:hypothetical protein